MVPQTEQSAILKTFQGEKIDSAITEQELQVWVGDAECVVRSISATSLRCTLPEERPSNGDFMSGDKERNLPVVWVSLEAAQS